VFEPIDGVKLTDEQTRKALREVGMNEDWIRKHMGPQPLSTYVAHRAKEPTSWAGLITAALGAVQAFQAGDLNGALTGGVLVITGLISIFRKERKPA